MSRNVRKRSSVHVRHAKIQVRMRIFTDCQESLLNAIWIAKDVKFPPTDKEYSDQIARIHRLI